MKLKLGILFAVIVAILFGGNYYINYRVYKGFNEINNPQVKVDQKRDLFGITQKIVIDSNGKNIIINSKINNYILGVIVDGNFSSNIFDGCEGNFSYNGNKLKLSFNDIDDKSFNIKKLKASLDMPLTGLKSINVKFDDFKNKDSNIKNFNYRINFNNPITASEVKNIYAVYKANNFKKFYKLIIELSNKIKNTKSSYKEINFDLVKLIDVKSVIDNNENKVIDIMNIKDIFVKDKKLFSNILLKINFNDVKANGLFSNLDANLTFINQFNKKDDINLFVSIDEKADLNSLSIPSLINLIKDFKISIVSEDKFQDSFKGILKEEELENLDRILSKILIKDKPKYYYEVTKDKIFKNLLF